MIFRKNLASLKNDRFSIKTDELCSEKIGLTISDALGNLKIQQTIEPSVGEPLRISLPNFAAGTYAVFLQCGEKKWLASTFVVVH